VAVAEVVVDRGKLADLDEARVYAAAASYNLLNAELGRLRAALAGGSVVRVEDEAGTFVLRSVGELLAWARGRFPYAEPK
jgi:hypothetical protein